MTLGKDIQSDWVALDRISCLKFRKCQASIKTIHLRLENIFLGVAASHYSCSVATKINTFQTDYPMWGEGFILGHRARDRFEMSWTYLEWLEYWLLLVPFSPASSELCWAVKMCLWLVMWDFSVVSFNFFSVQTQLDKILTQLVEIGPRQKKFSFRLGLKFLLNPNGVVSLPRLELFKGCKLQ